MIRRWAWPLTAISLIACEQSGSEEVLRGGTDSRTQNNGGGTSASMAARGVEISLANLAPICLSRGDSQPLPLALALEILGSAGWELEESYREGRRITLQFRKWDDFTGRSATAKYELEGVDGINRGSCAGPVYLSNGFTMDGRVVEGSLYDVAEIGLSKDRLRELVRP